MNDDLPYSDPPAPADGLHLRDYARIVLARWPLALAIWAAILLIAILYTWTRTPRYRASARILVESNEVNLTDMKGAVDASTSSSGQREFMQTQVQLITSRPVMEDALVNANLLTDPDFRTAKSPAERLATRVQALPVRNTHLIDVTLENKDPQKAARIVNAVVDAFLAQNRQRRMGVSDEGVQELQLKQEDLRVKLADATDQLQRFMVTNNIVSFEKLQSVELETLMALNRDMTEKEPLRLGLQARVEAAEAALARGEPADSLPNVIASQVVSSLRLDLAKLEQQYAQMLSRLGTNHPQLLALHTQIETLRTRIALEASTILQSMRTAYDQACKEEALIKQSIHQQESKVFRYNDLTAQYNVLKQNKDSIESTYQTIVRRIQEIESNRMGTQGENIFVISRATPPTEHSWPSHGKHLLVALLLGAVAAVGLCFFLDYMDLTIKTDAEIVHLLHTRVLAAIPGREPGETPTPHPDLVVREAPHSPTAEAFRSLRTAAAHGRSGDPLRAIVVSSTMSAEGKSFVATNVATAEASINRRTLLIDADMRRPRLHHVFPVPTEHGLSDILSGTAGILLDNVIHPSGIENLWVMPCGSLPGNPVELIESPRFVDMLHRLRARFDMLVIDSPPGLALVDSTVMSKHTDGLLLVVRSLVTPKAAAHHFAESLRAANVRLLGVVLNNVDVPIGHYGYAYGKYRYTYGRYGAAESSRPPTPWDTVRAKLAKWLGIRSPSRR